MTLRCYVEVDTGKALAAKEYIEAAGLRVDNVSGCGTGTHTITGRLPWITELQGGSYTTMDAQYAAEGGADYENALTVLVTVIIRPRSDKAIVDARLKAITPVFGDPSDHQRIAGVAELLDAGYRGGVLLSQDVVTRTHLAEYGGSGDARVARGLAGRTPVRPARRGRRG